MTQCTHSLYLCTFFNGICCINLWCYTMIENFPLLKNPKNHFQNLLMFTLKSKLLVPPHQSASVYIPTNVPFYNCANNRWRYLKLDNQLDRQKMLTNWTSSSTISLPATVHTGQISIQVLRIVLPVRIFLWFREHHLWSPPPPSTYFLVPHYVLSYDV
jgi:hypothetical protein